MKKTNFVWNRDRITSIGILILSVFLMLETQKVQPTFQNVGGSDPGSRMFPYVIEIIMILCAIGKFITCNQPDKEPFLNGKKGQLRICIVIGVLALYVWCLPKLGFMLCTFIFSVIQVYVMRDQVKVRPWAVLLFAAIVTGTLYLVFQMLIGVRLPVGSIWKVL